jgi:hypothetical protein
LEITANVDNEGVLGVTKILAMCKSHLTNKSRPTEGVGGDLPEILRLIEGVPCINAENSGVAGGGIRTLQLAIRQLPEYVSKRGLVS